MWLDRFGRYSKDDLSPREWLKADDQPNELAAVHLRVSTELDEEAGAVYVQVRLKVRGTAFIESGPHRALKAALSRIELMYQGRLVSTDTSRPLEIFTGVAVIYFVLAYPQSIFVNYLCRRFRVHE